MRRVEYLGRELQQRQRDQTHRLKTLRASPGPGVRPDRQPAASAEEGRRRDMSTTERIARDRMLEAPGTSRLQGTGLSSRAWRRIATVASAVSVLMGGAT